jgi:hypothetical protein
MNIEFVRYANKYLYRASLDYIDTDIVPVIINFNCVSIAI